MVYGTNNDSAIVEDYLAGCKPIHVIPSYASIDEMMYFVIESSEEDFNNMMMETGIHELQYYEESGNEYIYEASGIKGMIDNVVKFFEDMWKKVQDLIQDAIGKIEEKAQKFRSTIMSKIDDKFIKDKVDKIDDKKSFGSSYDFADIVKEDKVYQKLLADAERDINGYYKDATKEGAKVSVEDIDDKISSRIARCAKYISGSESATSATSITKSIKDQLRSKPKDWKGSDVKNLYHNEHLVDEVTKFPETKRTLKGQYDTMKKRFNETIKNVRDAGHVKFFEASIFSKTIKGFKTLKQMAVCCEQASVSVLNERYNLYRSFLLKIIGGRVKHESAMMSESSTSDAIDSLFNW